MPLIMHGFQSEINTAMVGGAMHGHLIWLQVQVSTVKVTTMHAIRNIHAFGAESTWVKKITPSGYPIQLYNFEGGMYILGSRHKGQETHYALAL